MVPTNASDLIEAMRQADGGHAVVVSKSPQFTHFPPFPAAVSGRRNRPQVASLRGVIIGSKFAAPADLPSAFKQAKFRERFFVQRRVN